MKNIRSLFVLLFTGVSFLGFSQSEVPSQWCGTQFTEAMMDKVQSATERHMNGTLAKSNLPYDIPITLHNMRNSNGTGGVDMLQTLEVFCEVIDFYAQHDINLYINEMKTHDNSNWTTDPNNGAGSADDAWGGIKLVTIGIGGNNTINIYNFKSLYNTEFEVALCGYFSPFHDVVAFSQAGNCFSKETIIHELGHYFALPHTFFGFEGPEAASNCGVYVTSGEKVDGSNCATAADRICDTPPDNSAVRLACPGGSGCQMYDRDGVSFFPDVTNIMSYFFDNCVNKFTEGQRAVMHNNIDEDRQDLLVLAPPANTSPVTEMVELNSPLDTEKPYDHVLFTWDPTPNANLYYFEVNSLSNFSPSFRVESIILETTQYVSTELQADRTYYWRVMPFNNSNTCSAGNTIASGTFTTSDQTVAMEDVESLTSFNVSPNPVNNNSSVIVSLNSTKSMGGLLSLYNVAGQRIHSEAIEVATSNNTFNLDVKGLAAGLYVVHLEFAEGAIQQKLIIQ